MATRYSRMYIAEQLSFVQNSLEISEIMDALRCIRSQAWTLGDDRQRVIAAIESELSKLRSTTPRDETHLRLLNRLEDAFMGTLSVVQK